jgi:hypothetical protein
MLIIIGGTSRSGKTLLAGKLLLKGNIPYMPLDTVVMGFTNGIPEYGVSDKLFPDEIARRIWKFTKAMCGNFIFVGKDYTIEGEAVLPEQVHELLKMFPGKIKTCFLGYTEIDVPGKVREVKSFSAGPDDWLIRETDETILNHITNMAEYSKFIREECGKYHIQYFDTSRHFMNVIDEALNYLLNDGNNDAQ